jgi:hypothetical protein
MARDLLEQFRGKSAEARAAPAPVQSGYEAYRRADSRQVRLKLRPKDRAWERINYGYLQRIVEDGDFGTQIGLVYSFAVVIIKGRNLQPVIDAIDAEQCEVVQQFDSERWEKPLDPKAAFVERIEFHVQTKVEAADALIGPAARGGKDLASVDASA